MAIIYTQVSRDFGGKTRPEDDDDASEAVEAEAEAEEGV